MSVHWLKTAYTGRLLPDATAPDEDVLQMGYSAILQEQDNGNVTLQHVQDLVKCKLEAITFAVAVMFFNWQFQLSSASCNSPLYVSPDFNSTWGRET